MSFAETTTAHSNSGRLVEQGVTARLVRFPELAAFDAARRNLAALIREGAMHELWDEGLKIISTIHAKIARTPCRPSWLIAEILDERGGRRVLDRLEARLASVDAEVCEKFDPLKTELDALSLVERNPLLDGIEELRSLEGKTLFVLRDFRLWEEARSCLDEVLDGHDWEIVKPSSLRSYVRADRLYIFGPPWFLSYRDEDFLLRAPAASVVHLVACAHEFAGDVRFSLLGESEKIAIHRDEDKEPEALPSSNPDPWNFEPISPTRSGRIRFKDSEGTRIWESGKKVKAIPFRLGGSRGTYFGGESSAWVVTADCSGPAPVCFGVEKTPVEELEPGGMVLMTTSGGGDMIPVVADMILFDSNQIRKLQHKWKSALLAQVELQGLDNVSSRLKALGALKASTGNLKNWCNPRSIGMENLETDLMAVLKLVGMESRFSDVVSGIGALRSAHQSAGAKLQKKLRESLEGKDLSEVFRQGYLEIRHGDGPAKTVFLIEERGDEAEIPEEWEGELMEIDD